MDSQIIIVSNARLYFIHDQDYNSMNVLQDLRNEKR